MSGINETTPEQGALVAKLLRLTQDDMPGLGALLSELGHSKPLKGGRIVLCLMMTPGNQKLLETLRQLGADVKSCGTLDDFPMAVQEDKEKLWRLKTEALDWGSEGGPYMIVDHGAEATLLIRVGVEAEDEFQKTGNLPDLTSISNYILRSMMSVIKDGLQSDPQKYHKIMNGLACVCDPTYVGVKRLYEMQARGTLPCPVINIQGSLTKINSGSHYGLPKSSQSAYINSPSQDGSSQALHGWGTNDSFLRRLGTTTQVNSHSSYTNPVFENHSGSDYLIKLRHAVNTLTRPFLYPLSGTSIRIGSKVVVCGYGGKGRHAADALKKAGAHVIITEIDPIPAYQAMKDGFKVHNWEDVYQTADYIVTATGKKDTITVADMKKMKNNTIIIDYGHLDNEIDTPGLEAYPGVQKISMPNGFKWVFPETRKGIIVIVLPDACPTSDVQTMIVVGLIELSKEKDAGKYKNEVYVLPEETVEYVAMLHLQQLGAKLVKGPSSSSCTTAALDGQTYLCKRKAGLLKRLTSPKTKAKDE